jgi:hypothetical protein
MYTYTNIHTENGGIELSSRLEDGKYSNPALTFHRVTGSYKKEGDPINEVWDNSKYLIDELYLEIAKFSSTDSDPGIFDLELQYFLEVSKCSLSELKALLEHGIKIGFFDQVECDFFA